MSGKTYATNRELALNALGVQEQFRNKGTMLAVDPSLSGGDDSVVVATGMQDGCFVIVGIHVLKKDVDQALSQLVELAERHNAVTIGVERAACGHHILKSLNNQIGNRTFNVVVLSHEGRSKKAR